MEESEKKVVIDFLDYNLPVVSENWRPSNPDQDLEKDATVEEFAIGVYLTFYNRKAKVKRDSRSGKRNSNEVQRKSAPELRALLQKAFNGPLRHFKAALSTNKEAMKILGEAAKQVFGLKYKFLKPKPSANSSITEGGEESVQVVDDCDMQEVFADIYTGDFFSYMEEAVAHAKKNPTVL